MIKTSQIESRHIHNWYRDWAKAAFITGILSATLWILLFKAPFLAEHDALSSAVVYVLILPGIFFMLPFGVQNIMRGHGFSPVALALGVILTWLFYSQLVYLFLRFRRRKREAGLPPAKPEEFSYTDRWQKPVSGSKL